MERKPGIKILPAELAAETMRSIVEEFVTRDGTELTDAATKIGEVERHLRDGTVEIWFDEATRTCNLLPVPAPEHRRSVPEPTD